MSAPIVSIGIPTYNRPQMLERALHCLVNQTYPHLEIIVSNDCSNNSEVDAVIAKFTGDPRVKYFNQPVNIGMTSNQNFVLRQASGSFFMRLADDDYIDSDYIENCLNFLLEHPDYSSAYGPAKYYNLKNDWLDDDAKIDLIEDKGSDRVRHYIKNVRYNGTSYGLMRRENWRYLFVENKLANDWFLVSRIAFIGKFKMLENTHSHLSAGGISQSIDHLTTSLGSSSITKSFFYLTIAKNIFMDILFNSAAYKRINFFRRFNLASRCFLIVYRRFYVKNEFKRYIKSKLKINK